MNEPEIELKRKGRGFAAAAAIFFSLAVWFAFLGIYLYNSMINYKPPPNGVQEGDMVSAFVMILMFGAAILSLIISFACLLIYLFKHYRNKNDLNT